mgnify:CR=1 FL=1
MNKNLLIETHLFEAKVQEESNGTIEKQLLDQITALAATKKVVAPWLPQTFTIGD